MAALSPPRERGVSVRPRAALLGLLLALLLGLCTLSTAQMWTVLERASAAQERLLELTGVTRDVRALEIAALRLGDPALSPAPAPLLAEVRALSAELRGTLVMGAAERAPFAVLLSALARLDAALAGPAAGQRQAADEVAQAAQTLASALNRRTDAEMTWTQATEALGRQQLWRMTGVTALLLLALAALGAEALRERTRVVRQLEALAQQDGLTGVANRRHWDALLGHAAAQAARSGQHLALVMLDLDHFKAFNDRRGHQAGDDLLRDLAGLLVGAAAPQATVARYGGEEFSVLWPGDSAQAVAEWLDHLRREVPADVTFSAGVTHLRPGESPDEALRRADEALYAAKHGGRARTVVAP
ncbi:diguanylate cyclase domain-containing protein [uncultured Deinococcus sp.]|uniref:GGDEF domain-containing protein n=1 Tax=uncultured Deinococcus sp. TaxID=158789 RepID=UPI0037497E26